MQPLHFLTLILPALTLASPLPDANAEPLAGAKQQLNERSLGGVYYCNNINYGAPCVKHTYPLAQCQDLSSTYAGQVSSIGPDSGTSCEVYAMGGCIPTYGTPNNGHITINYPGYSDLRTVNFNDKIQSIICYQA
ncbi:MAG: hypothetical protein Q9202_003424 [Teloschistes flavicans]